MDDAEFHLSLSADAPPRGLTPATQALWWDRKGRWDQAHAVVAEDESREAAWVHAYLHRREGDAGNARYWYAQARQPVCSRSLDQEWSAIAAALLASPIAKGPGA